MDGYLPLKPGGQSFSIAGTPTPSAGVVLLPGGSGEASYIFDNTRNLSAAWIGYGMTSGLARANAVVPVIGAMTNAIPIGAGTVQAFTLNAGVFVSVIMEQGSGTVTGLAGYGT